MRRVVLAMALVALTMTLSFEGTFSDYTQTRSNSGAVGTLSSFAPVKLTDPAIAGTVALLNSLTLTPGTWGYTHTPGEVIGTSGEQSITQVEQWQYCLSGTCHDIAGATGNTLSITGGLLTTLGLVNLTGVTFQVVETAQNISATATPVTSNTL